MNLEQRCTSVYGEMITEAGVEISYDADVSYTIRSWEEDHPWGMGTASESMEDVEIEVDDIDTEPRVKLSQKDRAQIEKEVEEKVRAEAN